jgi:hypothetical protein
VTGAPGDVHALAGEWRGDYASDETGRSGNIIFGLAAGSDTAFGDVLMIPDGYGEAPRDGDSALDRWRQSPDVLSIRFVQVGGGIVRGALDPYEDPECRCQVTTVFEGRLSGDTIEGTFWTRPEQGGPARQGRWRVARTARP